MRLSRAAIVLVEDQSGHLLMLRRGTTAPVHPGLWNFPGGYVDDWDLSPRHAAARELAEESGICVSPSLLQHWLTYNESSCLIHVYRLDVSERPVVSFPDQEHDAYRWCRGRACCLGSVPAVDFILRQIGSTRVSRVALPNGQPSDIMQAEGKRMSKFVTSDYMASWPKAVPFPYSISRSTRPVPNSNAVNWPQSQFAPLYLAPGSPSFQPYSYFKEDVPLKSEEPPYLTTNFFPYARSGYGPGGDTSALPNYGDPMSRPRRQGKVSISSRLAILKNKIKALMKGPKSTDRDVRAAELRQKAARLRALSAAEMSAVRAVANVSALGNTVRMGMRSTGQMIPPGVPKAHHNGVPASSIIPNRSGHSATGLDLGDGFAYELAPLQAQVNVSSHRVSATDLGDLSGDCGCGGRANPAEDSSGTKMLIYGTLFVAGLYFLYSRYRSAREADILEQTFGSRY